MVTHVPLRGGVLRVGEVLTEQHAHVGLGYVGNLCTSARFKSETKLLYKLSSFKKGNSTIE